MKWKKWDLSFPWPLRLCWVTGWWADLSATPRSGHFISFLISKSRDMIVAASWGCCEDAAGNVCKALDTMICPWQLLNEWKLSNEIVYCKNFHHTQKRTRITTPQTNTITQVQYLSAFSCTWLCSSPPSVVAEILQSNYWTNSSEHLSPKCSAKKCAGFLTQPQCLPLSRPMRICGES